MSAITNVTQNNTGMYTKESSQQTFKIPNNNFDVRFEKAYQNHNNELLPNEISQGEWTSNSRFVENNV